MGDVSAGSAGTQFLPYWACHRFQELYSDVVVPLLQRVQFLETAGLVDSDQGDRGIDSSVCSGDGRKCCVQGSSCGTPRLKGASVSSESSGAQPPLGNSSQRMRTILSKDSLTTELFGALLQNVDYLAAPMGIGGVEKGSRRVPYAGARAHDFDGKCLAHFVDEFFPELIYVRRDLLHQENGDCCTRSMHVEAVATTLDSSERVGMRRAVLEMLVDILSERCQVHQVECVGLIAQHLAGSPSSGPVALMLESLGTRTPCGVILIPSAVLLVERCLDELRREQAYQLGCLLELATSLYPVSEAGVSVSASVNIAALGVLTKLVEANLIENVVFALEYALQESTRQRVYRGLSEPNRLESEAPVIFEPRGFGKIDIESDEQTLLSMDAYDRRWSRRLAHLLAKLLILLVARFHVSVAVLRPVILMLEGAGFDASAGKRLTVPRHALDESGCTVTTRDFDLSVEGLLEGDRGAGMSLKLILTFLLATDPLVIRWDVRGEFQAWCNGRAEEICTRSQWTGIEEVNFPTARGAPWYDASLNNAAVPGNVRPVLDFLTKNDCYDAAFPGQLLSAVHDARSGKEPLNWSSKRSLFTGLAEFVLLSSVGADGDIAQIMYHTVTSFLQQMLLPLDPNWSAIMRADQAGVRNNRNRVASRKSASFFMKIASDTGPLLPTVLRTLVILCQLHPPAISGFTPILHSILETYPWPAYVTEDGPDFNVKQNEHIEDRVCGLASSKFKNQGKPLKSGCNPYVTHHQGDPEAAFRFAFSGTPQRRSLFKVPVTSGVGVPAFPPDADKSFGAESDRSFPDRCLRKCQSGEVLTEQAVSLFGRNEVHDLLLMSRLMARVFDFAAAVIAAGPWNEAVNAYSKMCTQPSLGLFYVATSAQRIRTLFSEVASGEVQLSLWGQFAHKQRTLVRLSGSYDEDDEDEELSEKLFKESIDRRICCLCAVVASLTRLLASAHSRRLLTIQLPIVATMQNKTVPVQCLLDILYDLISAPVNLNSSPSLGFTGCGVRINFFSVVIAKVAAIEALSAAFSSAHRAQVTSPERLFVIFVNQLLPVLLKDMAALRREALNAKACKPTHKKLGPSQSFSQTDTDADWTAAHSVLGRLASAIAIYICTMLWFRGVQRYFRDNLPGWAGSLLKVTQFVCTSLIPLLSVPGGGLILSRDFWVLSLVTLKILRFVARGPLPFCGVAVVDRTNCAGFEEVGSEPIEECAATTWLLKHLLTLDNLSLDAVIQLGSRSWKHLAGDGSPGEETVMAETVCDTALDVLALLCQRDLLIQQMSKKRPIDGQNRVNGTDDTFLRSFTEVSSALLSDMSRLNTVAKSPLGKKCSGIFAVRNYQGTHVPEFVPKAGFLLRAATSEKHILIRRKAIYILWQLMLREPSVMADVFAYSAEDLIRLRSMLARILANSSLEEEEIWSAIRTFDCNSLEGCHNGNFTSGWSCIDGAGAFNSNPLWGQLVGNSSFSARAAPDVGTDELRVLPYKSSAECPRELYFNEPVWLPNIGVSESENIVEVSHSNCFSQRTCLPINELLEVHSNIIEEGVRLSSDLATWDIFQGMMGDDISDDDQFFIACGLIYGSARVPGAFALGLAPPSSEKRAVEIPLQRMTTRYIILCMAYTLLKRSLDDDPPAILTMMIFGSTTDIIKRLVSSESSKIEQSDPGASHVTLLQALVHPVDSLSAAALSEGPLLFKYFASVCAVLSLQILLLFLTRRPTVEVALALLAKRLPQRHVLVHKFTHFTAVWQTDVTTPASLTVQSFHNLHLGLLLAVLAQEMHLCSQYTAAKKRGRPSWKRDFSQVPHFEAIRDSRLDCQCFHVASASMAFFDAAPEVGSDIFARPSDVRAPQHLSLILELLRVNEKLLREFSKVDDGATVALEQVPHGYSVRMPPPTGWKIGQDIPRSAAGSALYSALKDASCPVDLFKRSELEWCGRKTSRQAFWRAAAFNLTENAVIFYETIVHFVQAGIDAAHIRRLENYVFERVQEACHNFLSSVELPENRCAARALSRAFATDRTSSVLLDRITSTVEEGVALFSAFEGCTKLNVPVLTNPFSARNLVANKQLLLARTTMAHLQTLQAIRDLRCGPNSELPQFKLSLVKLPFIYVILVQAATTLKNLELLLAPEEPFPQVTSNQDSQDLRNAFRPRDLLFRTVDLRPDDVGWSSRSVRFLCQKKFPADYSEDSTIAEVAAVPFQIAAISSVYRLAKAARVVLKTSSDEMVSFPDAIMTWWLNQHLRYFDVVFEAYILDLVAYERSVSSNDGIATQLLQHVKQLSISSKLCRTWCTADGSGSQRVQRNAETLLVSPPGEAVCCKRPCADTLSHFPFKSFSLVVSMWRELVRDSTVKLIGSEASGAAPMTESFVSAAVSIQIGILKALLAMAQVAATSVLPTQKTEMYLKLSELISKPPLPPGCGAELIPPGLDFARSVAGGALAAVDLCEAYKGAAEQLIIFLAPLAGATLLGLMFSSVPYVPTRLASRIRKFAGIEGTTWTQSHAVGCAGVKGTTLSQGPAVGFDDRMVAAYAACRSLRVCAHAALQRHSQHRAGGLLSRCSVHRKTSNPTGQDARHAHRILYGSHTRPGRLVILLDALKLTEAVLLHLRSDIIKYVMHLLTIEISLLINFYKYLLNGVELRTPDAN